jgi:hypothetical protein
MALWWSIDQGLDGPTKKACLVVGLSKPMDEPVAKCGNCERELRELNISRLYVEWVLQNTKIPLFFLTTSPAPL